MLDWDQTPSEEYRHGAVTIGNFDGVHRGHAALIHELCRQARAVGGPAVAVTFDPHPLQLLHPEQFRPVQLTTLDVRSKLLLAGGADQVLIMRTTKEMLHLRAEEFFTRVLRGHLDARALVEGINFGFGRDREGNVDTLRSLCAEAAVPLAVVPPVTNAAGQPISSSRVRAALLAGDVGTAAELIGRPYRLAGQVEVGQRRGRTLGFPTANLGGIVTLVPKDGVYAVRVRLDKTDWPGAANIGPNPTFGEQARKVEVHVIGFQGDLYGREIEVDFLQRLRDTRSFAGIEQLVAQLRQDVEAARRSAGG